MNYTIQRAELSFNRNVFRAVCLLFAVLPSQDHAVLIDVPEMTFIAVDGKGDPKTAVKDEEPQFSVHGICGSI